MRLSIRVVAPVLAVLLGLGGGTAAALLVDTDSPSEDSPAADPLGLGIDLVDLECTGEALLVIGWGDGSAALAGAIADNRDSAVRYLRTADSCNTLYGREKGFIPEYAVFLGPYFSIAEACALRMTVPHRGDQVTVLKAGNEQAVRCACHLSLDTFPELTPGMSSDAATSPWVRALQQFLVDIDAESFPQSRVTGAYDDATVARVRELQTDAQVEVTGVADAVTWGTLRNRACVTYDY